MDRVASDWELWYINYIEENKSTYSYVCQKFARFSVGNSLANRIVFVVTGHVPKADASIDRAVHAVLVQTPIWLGLPPHKVSNGTKRVHPEPVTLPVNANICVQIIFVNKIFGHSCPGRCHQATRPSFYPAPRWRSAPS